MDRPVLNGTARVANLAVNGERVGGLSVQLQTRDNELRAELTSQFLRGRFGGNLAVSLGADFPARGRIEFADVDLDPLFTPALRGRITTHSTATGWATVSGPLKKSEALEAKLEVTGFHVALEKLDLRNRGPLLASYRTEPCRLSRRTWWGPTPT